MNGALSRAQLGFRDFGPSANPARSSFCWRVHSDTLAFTVDTSGPVTINRACKKTKMNRTWGDGPILRVLAQRERYAFDEAFSHATRRCSIKTPICSTVSCSILESGL